MGQPKEGLPLHNEKMNTPFINNNRLEECGTSCFRGEVKYLFTFNRYHTLVHKNICESDG
jgi:hypothetical protein